MRNYTRSNLREKASKIIEKYAGLPTIDILDMLKKEQHFSKIEFEPSAENEHIKGAVIINKDYKNIFIKSDIPDNEKLFVYAHEISHILLHSGQDHMDFIPSLVNPEKSDIETEANTLAYELVFPFAKFVNLYQENNGDLESLAYCFKASIYRTKKRIEFLRKQISLNEIDNFMAV